MVQAKLCYTAFSYLDWTPCKNFSHNGFNVVWVRSVFFNCCIGETRNLRDKFKHLLVSPVSFHLIPMKQLVHNVSTFTCTYSLTTPNSIFIPWACSANINVWTGGIHRGAEPIHWIAGTRNVILTSAIWNVTEFLDKFIGSKSWAAMARTWTAIQEELDG